MSEISNSLPNLDLLIGAVVVVAILLKAWFERMGLPALVGFIGLGFMLQGANQSWGLITEQGQAVFEFLASIGVITLLFRVGLQSNFRGLVAKLPRAAPIWVSNVLLSGLLGYTVAHHWLGIALVPSLFIATALSATSVAVVVEAWREAGALHSSNGELLLDVAELDDITAVALMALLFAIAPALNGEGGGPVIPLLAKAGGTFLVKALAFAALCLVFARYLEKRVTRLIKATTPPEPMLLVAGIGIVIAALAGLLGFSVAVGALFAGLVFSRDPEAVRMGTLFEPMHDFFMPFFFIGVGLSMDPGSIASASALGVALLVVAIVGKVVGSAGPAVFTTGWAGATLIGVSMVPRAEIALVVAQEGRRLGDWAVPPEVYSAIALVAAATCTVVPILLRTLLRDWPQGED